MNIFFIQYPFPCHLQTRLYNISVEFIFQINMYILKISLQYYCIQTSFLTDPRATNLTDDNSLLTDDSDSPELHTPPKQQPPNIQPS